MFIWKLDRNTNNQLPRKMKNKVEELGWSVYNQGSEISLSERPWAQGPPGFPLLIQLTCKLQTRRKGQQQGCFEEGKDGRWQCPSSLPFPLFLSPGLGILETKWSPGLPSSLDSFTTSPVFLLPFLFFNHYCSLIQFLASHWIYWHLCGQTTRVKRKSTGL